VVKEKLEKTTSQLKDLEALKYKQEEKLEVLEKEKEELKELAEDNRKAMRKEVGQLERKIEQIEQKNETKEFMIRNRLHVMT